MKGYLGDRPLPKLDLASAGQQQRQRHLFWLLLIIVICPNIGAIARAVGLQPTKETMLAMTVVMGVICLAGVVFGYRNARSQAARDIEESM